MTRRLLIAALLIFTGCRAPGGNSTSASSGTEIEGRSIELELIGEPRLGSAQLKVTVADKSAPVEGATVELMGDMTHAGMVPVIAEAVMDKPGVYLSEGFKFTMAGDWLITAEVTFPDGERQNEILPLSVSGR